MKNSFVIFGSSGHARVVLENLLSQGRNDFLGWIDSNEKKDSLIFSYPVIGKDEDLKSLYEKEKFAGIIGIGNIEIRKRVADFILNEIPDFEFINGIHSSAIISPSAKLGKGIAIMPGAIINTESLLGDHCIINSGAQIDHNCEIGNFVNLAPSVILGGNVKISDQCEIGMGSNIINNSFIPINTKIKAGTRYNNRL